MRQIHLAQSVRGALKKSMRELRALAEAYKKEDGTHPSAEELWEYFADQLAQGRELLPIGKCPDFNYKSGCPGHEMVEREHGEDIAVTQALGGMEPAK
jgi:hypothetical protein